MNLYIANCSMQKQELNFRIPESTKVHTQTIESGAQALIVGASLNEVQADSVISQLRKYGLLAVGEIGKSVPSQIPLVFSTGSTINADVIRKVISHNRGILRIQGQELRTQAAIAVHNQLEQETPGAVNAVELSVEEVTSGGMPHDDDDGPLAEGIRVAAERGSKPKGRGGRGKK